MLFDFRGRVTIVTGGASGIGRACAEGFSAHGAKVFVLDRNADLLAQSVASVREKHPHADITSIPLDITDDDAVDDSISRIAAECGEIHHLVNSAVNFVAAGVDSSREDWDAAFGVNVTSASLLSAKFSRHAGPDATIVNISSISAHAAQPDRWTYNATKAAILALTRGQALDLAPQGIRVNAVSPGWVWTPEVEKAAGGEREKWEPIWGRFHILRRLGNPEEIANPVLFLSSPLSSFITGAELLVDGGYRALGPEGLGDTAKFAAREER